MTSTPDWMLYWTAHHNDFDALVTRDLAQRTQLVEMYVLSKLRGFSIITWKRPIEDPITEWGQLIAYLPEIRKRLEHDDSRGRSGTVILLPKPTLGTDNVLDAKDIFGKLANDQGISYREARDLAMTELEDVIEASGSNRDDFDDLL